ncbi:MAG: hypothetical protein ACI4C1_08755 [Lachnospiraceae bacterium]
MSKFMKVLGSIILMMAILLCGIVIYFQSELKLISELRNGDNCVWAVEYHWNMDENEIPQNLLFSQRGQIQGERIDGKWHGYYYLDEEEIPLTELYGEGNTVLFNLKSLYEYMIQKLNVSQNLISFDWASGLVDNYYVSGKQLEEIMGGEQVITAMFSKLSTTLSEENFSMGRLLGSIKSCKVPEESYYAMENPMRYYQYTVDEGTALVVIGVPKKLEDTRVLHVMIEDGEFSLEVKIQYRSQEFLETIDVPQESMTQEQVEQWKTIYEKLAALRDWF